MKAQCVKKQKHTRREQQLEPKCHARLCSRGSLSCFNFTQYLGVSCTVTYSTDAVEYQGQDIEKLDDRNIILSGTELRNLLKRSVTAAPTYSSIFSDRTPARIRPRESDPRHVFHIAFMQSASCLTSAATNTLHSTLLFSTSTRNRRLTVQTEMRKACCCCSQRRKE